MKRAMRDDQGRSGPEAARPRSSWPSHRAPGALAALSLASLITLLALLISSTFTPVELPRSDPPSPQGSVNVELAPGGDGASVPILGSGFAPSQPGPGLLPFAAASPAPDALARLVAQRGSQDTPTGRRDGRRGGSRDGGGGDRGSRSGPRDGGGSGGGSSSPVGPPGGSNGGGFGVADGSDGRGDGGGTVTPAPVPVTAGRSGVTPPGLAKQAKVPPGLAKQNNARRAPPGHRRLPPGQAKKR